MNSEIIIFPVFFISIILILKISLDHRLRSKIVDKGNVDINENIRHLFRGYDTAGAQSSLKWGMVCLAVGIGMLAGILTARYTTLNDEIIPAFMFTAAGLALVIYYAVAKNWNGNGGGQ